MEPTLQNEILKKLDKIETKLDDYQARLIQVESQQGFIRRGFQVFLTIATSVCTYLFYRYIDNGE